METKILEAQWLKGIPGRISIFDEAAVSQAREEVRRVGAEARLSREIIENMAIVASELACNQLSHAKRGEIAVRKIEVAGVTGLEIIAADQGPGIENPRAVLQGNLSTSGGMGAGLGAVFRLSDLVDIDIRLGEGTCIWARKYSKPPSPVCCELAIMGRPYPGEAKSGDSGIFIREGENVLAAVADGLGHGLLAQEASLAAIQCIRDGGSHPLDSLLLQCNSQISETRGCTLSLARLRWDQQQIEHTGVGDVSMHAYHLQHSKRFVMNAHILGQPWTGSHPIVENWSIAPGAVLTLFTDGLKSEAGLDGELEILRQPAVVIAQHLLEHFGRRTDDALVLVAKLRRMA